jgi:predicted nuclease of predicted toxin-antitoxin system
MKLLLDAHISRRIIAILEARGHDLLRASTFALRTSDESILRRAAAEDRIVVTSDKDFGELVFRVKQRSAGVILLRIDVASEQERAAVVEKFWPQIEAAVPGHFVVVTSRTVRRSPLP